MGYFGQYKHYLLLTALGIIEPIQKILSFRCIVRDTPWLQTVLNSELLPSRPDALPWFRDVFAIFAYF